MAISLYDASIPVYQRRLTALSAILDKAAAYCAERKIEPSALINARLFADMLPLFRQVQISCGHALRGAARLSGQEPASLPDAHETFDDMKAAIAVTLGLLATADRATIDGMDGKDITFPAGKETMTMPAADYLLHFSMPNFYFHVTTAYDILRHNGLAIGKTDYMGA